MAQQIVNLTADANQLLTFVLVGGGIVNFTFVYRPAIQRWSLDVDYGTTLQLAGFNLALGPNVLRQWRNLIPFGLALVAVDGIDPILIDDFSSGRVAAYVLTADEVAQVESEILAPIPPVNA